MTASKIIWILGSAGLAIVGLYVAGAIYLLITQAKMVFMPTQTIEMTPKDVDLQFEEINFASSDNINLNGWFVPADGARGIILFCHGNGGNISHRLESIQIFNRMGLSVFIFDYQGYGQSEGKPSETGTYLDAEAAWKYLTETRNISEEKIIIFGRSLGGAIASHLAVDFRPGALIIESAFTSVGNMGSELYPFFPVKLLTRFKYTTVEYVAKISCPILVVHSPEDDIIPFHHGKKIFASAHKPKEFLEITGMHNDGFLVSGQKYYNGIESFIDKHIK